MVKNLFSTIYGLIKKQLTYQPNPGPKPFILNETPTEQGSGEPTAPEAPAVLRQMAALLRHAQRMEKLLKRTIEELGKTKLNSEKMQDLASELEIMNKQQGEIAPLMLAYNQIDGINRLVSASLAENHQLIRELYQLPENKDIIVRFFEIPCQPPVAALLVFIDGMIDKKVINLSILAPLMNIKAKCEQWEDGDLVQNIVSEALPSNQAKRFASFREIVSGINGGDTALFLEGATEAVLLETKGYALRTISKPQLEQSVRGSQAAFCEGFRINTGLMRTYLPTADLVTEIINVGDRVPMKCALMYLKTVANPQLVAEVKRRLQGISTDYIVDIGMLEQFLEDHPHIPFPQTLSTERPDRAAVHLTEGRVALILDGSPFAHILPVGLFTFIHSMEDFSFKTSIGTYIRLLRIAGIVLSVLLPSLYLAINYFHQEALPTELALAIASARERVPFPAVIEILLMDFSFELIREAGLRVPGLLGSTIGIVGAIILGQAAVAANIVSPIMVVIIAITGLASFAIPDYQLAIAVRIIRFVFLLLAATFGLVGLSFGVLILFTVLCSMKSFGMPYMAPMAPRTQAGLDVIIRGSVFKQERRPDELNTQDGNRQPPISRQWTQEQAVDKKEGEQ
jgi:spore germination protein KA